MLPLTRLAIYLGVVLLGHTVSSLLDSEEISTLALFLIVDHEQLCPLSIPPSSLQALLPSFLPSQPQVQVGANKTLAGLWKPFPYLHS